MILIWLNRWIQERGTSSLAWIIEKSYTLYNVSLNQTLYQVNNFKIYFLDCRSWIFFVEYCNFNSAVRHSSFNEICLAWKWIKYFLHFAKSLHLLWMPRYVGLFFSQYGVDFFLHKNTFPWLAFFSQIPVFELLSKENISFCSQKK